MTALTKYVSVVDRFARSVNLDRDYDQKDPLNGYIVTDRAQNVVERVAETAATGKSGGAWSLTGPYGSGKSSLAILIDAVFGPSSTTRGLAWQLIDEASPPIGKLIRQSHDRYQTDFKGFHRGLVTANREFLCLTILRSLHLAVIRSFGKIPTIRKFRAANLLRRALEDANSNDPSRTPSPTSVIEIARCLAEDAPLLLIIDEFGKNLESIRGDNNSDPYLLQLIAEAGQGLGLPIFILTLQHQSFDDYFIDANSTQRREWSKVQGRFEDIAYVESSDQSRTLIGSVFDVRDSKLKARISQWANDQFLLIQNVGITETTNPNVIASCYPLNPLTTLILPELCNRFGQHERTMFSFLTSSDPSSAATFIANTSISSNRTLPSIGLESIYDFFVSKGLLTNISNSQTGRWIEIATRLRDIHGLSEKQLKLAKSIAVLNLISTSGTIRASRKILALTNTNIRENLTKLESIGLVTYKDYADEYRIWQGTDVDINQLFGFAQQRLQKYSLVEVLKAVDSPTPVVAARHSAENEILRVFKRRYADTDEIVRSLDTFSPFDGEVLLVVGNKVPRLEEWSESHKPVVAIIPDNLDVLDRAAREIAAISAALDDPTVKSDWVAKSELEERLVHRQTMLERAFQTTFGDNTSRWFLLDSAEGTELPIGRGSAPLSAAADKAYSSTPMIRNEMINRNTISTQGAKARRILLQAMIENDSVSNLGLTGYGPEVAIYNAVLNQTGLHGRDNRIDSMVFRPPFDKSLLPAWNALNDEFTRARFCRVNVNDIFATLLSPPIGMKTGVVSILVTAALLAFRDEVAIYEHGTFKPLLTADLSERMVKNPSHFDIKHFANTIGARRQVIGELAGSLNLKPNFGKHRVANVLTVVSHLISIVRQLDKFTLQTNNLDPITVKVRDTLLNAVEPDRLLFESLPNAVGLQNIPTNAKNYKRAQKYVISVKSALEELVGCYDLLLANLFDFVLETCAESNRLSITGQASALENEVLNPTTKAFVGILANTSFKNEDWVKAIATVVAKKSPSEWTDDDFLMFQREFLHQTAAFRRLVALHANHRTDGGGPFIPLRVTITHSDGSEFVSLVSIDENLRHDARSALDKSLAQLVKITGSEQRAHRTLLALLSEQLMPDSEKEYNEIQMETIRKEITNG